jgi:hypothetical protein
MPRQIFALFGCAALILAEVAEEVAEVELPAVAEKSWFPESLTQAVSKEVNWWRENTVDLASKALEQRRAAAEMAAEQRRAAEEQRRAADEARLRRELWWARAARLFCCLVVVGVLVSVRTLSSRELATYTQSRVVEIYQGLCVAHGVALDETRIQDLASAIAAGTLAACQTLPWWHVTGCLISVTTAKHITAVHEALAPRLASVISEDVDLDACDTLDELTVSIRQYLFEHPPATPPAAAAPPPDAAGNQLLTTSRLYRHAGVMAVEYYVLALFEAGVLGAINTVLKHYVLAPISSSKDEMVPMALYFAAKQFSSSSYQTLGGVTSAAANMYSDYLNHDKQRAEERANMATSIITSLYFLVCLVLINHIGATAAGYAWGIRLVHRTYPFPRAGAPSWLWLQLSFVVCSVLSLGIIPLMELATLVCWAESFWVRINGLMWVKTRALAPLQMRFQDPRLFADDGM